MSAVPGVPAEAIEAAAKAMFESAYPKQSWASASGWSSSQWRESAQTALAAALPSLREVIAAEVLAPVEAALRAAWDDGNAMGLDGWIGPERGEEPDGEAIDGRRRHVESALAALSAPVQGGADS